MGEFRSKVISIGLHFIELIRSETALHIYTWIAIVIIFSLSTIITIRLLYKIRQFRNSDLIETIAGPAPQRERTIKRRITRLNGFAASVSRTIFRNAMVLVFVGIILPGAMLGVVAAKQSWISPGPYALTLNDEPTDSIEFAKTDLAVFVTDQALKGGLSDAIEVFDLGLGNVRNNPENRWFSALVFLYRLLSGAVVVTILILGYNVIKAIPHVKIAIGKWEHQLEDIQAQKTS